MRMDAELRAGKRPLDSANSLRDLGGNGAAVRVAERQIRSPTLKGGFEGF